MITAAFWSALATATLLIAMVLAYRNLVGPRWTGLIMAFTALELFDDARIIATVDAAERVIELSDRSKKANLAV